LRRGSEARLRYGETYGSGVVDAAVIQRRLIWWRLDVVKTKSNRPRSCRMMAEALVLSHFNGPEESPSPSGWLSKSSLTTPANDRLLITAKSVHPAFKKERCAGLYS
jgi:hypothetical protein